MEPRPKRARTRTSHHIENFKLSASSFRVYEEDALNICIQETDDVSEIFPGYSEVQTDPDLQHLKLEGFDHDRVLTFIPSRHEDLNDNQRRFLMKLKHVLMKSLAEGPDPSFEAYVQAMVDVLLQECKLDDSLHLEMVPSMLRMVVAERSFATFSDREGRKDGRLVWVLQQSKHKHDIRYKDGAIQLVSALIAACQRNYGSFSMKVFPQEMYGINVKGDEISIVRTVFTEKYILSLFGGLPKQRLEVKKFPKGRGLKLSSPVSRCEILSLMTKLRKHALSVSTTY